MFSPAPFVGPMDVVALATPITAASTTTAPTNPTAQYELNASGDVNKTNGNNTVVDWGDWVLPKAHAGSYECFATLDSGTLSTGTTGSWLALTSTRTWTVSRSSNGTSTAQITVQIRKVGGSTILATSVVTIQAQRIPA